MVIAINRKIACLKVDHRDFLPITKKLVAILNLHKTIFCLERKLLRERECVFLSSSCALSHFTLCLLSFLLLSFPFGWQLRTIVFLFVRYVLKMIPAFAKLWKSLNFGMPLLRAKANIKNWIKKENKTSVSQPGFD